MKYWTISFPGECGQHIQETWSEEQIMKSSWYRNWVLKMVQSNKHHLMTEEQAIDDWVVVHWAVETDEWGNKNKKARNVLFVCATHQHAKGKFNQMVKVLDAELNAWVWYSQLRIVFEEVTYSFVSTESDLEMKLRGHSFDDIIVDEYAKLNLTEAQDTYLKIVKRT